MGKWFFRGHNDISARLDELDALLLQRDEIAALLSTGRKIEAIKIYRQDTGASLAEAKTAVERMESAMFEHKTSNSLFWNTQAEDEKNAEDAAGREIHREAWWAEIEQLVRQKRKIEAIKLYRTYTNTGLREAKEAIDQLEQGLFRAGFPDPDFSHPGFPAFRPGRQAVEPNDEVRHYVQIGQKIKAIKAYREQTGLSLKDAKDEIDRLEQAMRLGLE